MDRAFAWDFSRVRLHAGSEGERFTAPLRARAATLHSDVFFGAREYQPTTPEGTRLLAHELAHVVQQTGGPRESDGPIDAERAADAAGDAVVRGNDVPFVLRNVPTQQPALQAQTWQQQVGAALNEPDLTRRSAMAVALVRQALPPSRTVHEAPVNASTVLAVADYHEAPEVNFDVRLNQKHRWPSLRNQDPNSTPPLSDDAGYTFRRYSILGPLVLQQGGEMNVRMYADHELFHADHHATSTASNADNEVEAWTDTFVHYFVATATQGRQWQPIVGYYEQATSTARTQAVAAISTFARALSTTPATGTPLSDRARFDGWLRHRLTMTPVGALITDLSRALGFTATPSAPASSASQNPSPPIGH
jgi:hypothetical protein